jgi:beta-galactosidase
MTEVNTAATQPATQIINHQREDILFDMLGKGLALTHRPFDAIELSRGALDPARTPVLWVMLDKVCPTATQQKLVDYVRGGGRLIVAGRMCVEDADHQPCTRLADALGLQTIVSDPPFTSTLISAFGVDDIPASFVESYTGAFAEVIATRADGAVVGLVQPLGQGRVLLFGAAVPANTLADLALVEHMARQMDCPALLTLTPWADARLSRGDQGSFLYLNNYQDDPVETTVLCQGEELFGGHPVLIPARQGQILPLDWRVNPAVTVHYCTSEIIAVEAAGGQLTLRTRQPEFFAELSLDGWQCAAGTALSASAPAQRVAVHGHVGTVVLTAVT